MPVCFYLELSAIVLHCIYGVVHWAFDMGGNINTEIAVPLLTGMFWLIAILYLGALVAAVLFSGITGVISTVVFGVVGIHIANLVLVLGLMGAVIGAGLLALVFYLLQTVPGLWAFLFL
ncbi:MAG: hypothetical protein IJB75_06845 [Oscillospiraceae bacterium]|nr:hypothetical protein [Oscillospiraceae bacterium]